MSRNIRKAPNLADLSILYAAAKEAEVSAHARLKAMLAAEVQKKRHALIEAIIHKIGMGAYKAEVCRELNISRPTLDRWISDYLEATKDDLALVDTSPAVERIGKWTVLYVGTPDSELVHDDHGSAILGVVRGLGGIYFRDEAVRESQGYPEQYVDRQNYPELLPLVERIKAATDLPKYAANDEVAPTFVGGVPQ